MRIHPYLAFRTAFLSLLLAVVAFATTSAAPAAANGIVLLEFDGLSRLDGDPRVPDVSGAVGFNHYLQVVNLQIALFDKFSGNLQDATSLNDFFSESSLNGTPCVGYNRGQSQVHYDHMSGRWLVSDVAYEDIDDGPYYQCVAVSRSVLDTTGGTLPLTADRSQHWAQYAFQIHPDYLHDQPKFGVWPDGYYMAADLYDVVDNGLHRTPKGFTVWAFNRDDLVAGNPTPDTQSFYFSESLGYFGLLPSNLIGPPPPTGTPNYFAAVAPPNKLYTWEFHVDWINTSQSTFSGPRTTIVNNFTWPVGFLAPQAGSDEQLDIVGQRLMQPLQYRHQVNGVVAPSLWANHTVGNGNTVGVRWYEIRNLTAPTPTIHQQGTHQQPADNDYRWLGSMAVDRQGNMALAYSRSSEGRHPGIYYTGRLATDPTGSLMPEARLIDGSASQDLPDPDTLVDGPWGRYSHMSVDPYNDCEFWYTNQYYHFSDSDSWRTWISKFSLVECDPINPGVVKRVSLHSDGSEGFGGGSGIYSTAISGNGRYVVFESEANTLVDGDNAGHVDVFVRDRDADGDGVFDEPGSVTTRRVSVGLGGSEANGDSGVAVTGDFGGSNVAISRDGRFIAFSSAASNLVPGDTNGTTDVFVYDQVNGSMERVSVSNGGAQGNAVSDQPSISQDGRYVAFRSFATSLLAGDTNNVADIYLRDRQTNTTTRISLGNGGVQALNGPSYTPAISPGLDGCYIAFTSDADNLGADADTISDVFVRNRCASPPTTTLISQGFGAGRSFHPSITANGQLVAFASQADNLVAGDTNNSSDIFLRFGSTTLLVSVDDFGNQGNRNSYRPSLSADGQYVAYETESSNILPGDFNGLRDIYIYKINSPRVIRKASFGYDGSEANGPSFWPAINDNGRHVAFASDANNLVSDDTNNLRDVFAHDRVATIPPGPELSVPQNDIDPVYAAEEIAIPIRFRNNGHSISSIAFELDLNNACLAFDPSDSNGDGIPDDVSFNLPAGYTATATYRGHNQTLEVSIYDPVSPVTPLGNSDLVHVTLRAICQPPVGGSQFTTVRFSTSPIATFGNTAGASVAGTMRNGAVEILHNNGGDCNDDGVVDAGDISAVILEIHDGDGTGAAATPGGTFPGEPRGCDPNQDSQVDAGDISCTILVIFNDLNGLIQCLQGSTTSRTATSANTRPDMSNSTDVGLDIGEVVAQPGETVSLPIHFTAGSAAINALVFSIDLDETLLAFNPADSDLDGVPDALHLALPPGFLAAVSYDAADVDGELDVTIFNPANPTVSLPSGMLAVLELQTGQTALGNVAHVGFASDPPVSFGSTSGQSVAGSADDGAVQFGSVAIRVYLPVALR